jgi:hypothetical protein
MIRNDDLLEIARSRESILLEQSAEAFDRFAFAERALALVHPERTTIALCQGAHRVHVEAGRQWGRPLGARWAVLSIPPRASRRAIAVAVATLAHADSVSPYLIDVLMNADVEGIASALEAMAPDDVRSSAA